MDSLYATSNVPVGQISDKIYMSFPYAYTRNGKVNFGQKSEKVGHSDLNKRYSLRIDIQCLCTKYEVISTFGYETCPTNGQTLDCII